MSPILAKKNIVFSYLTQPVLIDCHLLEQNWKTFLQHFHFFRFLKAVIPLRALPPWPATSPFCNLAFTLFCPSYPSGVADGWCEFHQSFLIWCDIFCLPELSGTRQYTRTWPATFTNDDGTDRIGRWEKGKFHAPKDMSFFFSFVSFICGKGLPTYIFELFQGSHFLRLEVGLSYSEQGKRIKVGTSKSGCAQEGIHLHGATQWDEMVGNGIFALGSFNASTALLLSA